MSLFSTLPSKLLPRGPIGYGLVAMDAAPDSPPRPTVMFRASTSPAAFDTRCSRAKAPRAVGKHGLQAVFTREEVSWISHRKAATKGPDERAFMHGVIHGEVSQESVCNLLGESVVDDIVEAMEYFEFEAGDTLLRQGDVFQHFFVVCSGILEVSDEWSTQTMCRGESFGGSALLYEDHMSTTITARESCAVWGIDGVTFCTLRAANAKVRHLEDCSVLESVREFDNLSAAQKIRVGEVALATKFFDAGAVVVEEGTMANAIWIVISGQLSVILGGSVGSDGLVGGRVVRKLSSRESFGKGCVLYNKLNKVSVRADVACELVCLGAGPLKDVLGSDLGYAIESSFIVNCLAKSPFLSQFSSGQKHQIVKAMDVETYAPLQSLDEADLDFAIVLAGQICSAADASIVVLDYGQLREVSTFALRVDMDIPKKRSSRSLTAANLVSTRDANDGGLIAGLQGVRVATLTKERLCAALREAGICYSTEESVEHARKLLLAKKVPIFHHLSTEQIDTLVQSFILVRLAKDAILFDQGAPATDFWVIANGEVEEVVDSQVKRVIGKLGHFGVRALLFREASSSTVRVLSESAEFWQLEGECFDQHVQGSVREELARRYQLRDTRVELRDLEHVRILGEGSFGVVRLVVHRGAALRYALKRVRKRGRKVLELVLRECALLAEMEHPLILTLVRTFETPTAVYILTELLTGGELLDALECIGRPLARSEAQFYAGSLLLVLEFLHERHVVFRDLKPENVMLDARGYVKLIDFGTAKKLSEGEARTFTIIGSFHFMAPEVSRGRGYGDEVDLWSLGVMIFEFVCGHLPFGHKQLDSPGLEVCSLVQVENLKFPAFYRDSTGRHLLREMLRKEPERRLGVGVAGHQYIKAHDFFAVEGPSSLFDLLLAREVEPPHTPDAETSPCRTDGASLSDADLLAP